MTASRGIDHDVEETIMETLTGGAPGLPAGAGPAIAAALIASGPAPGLGAGLTMFGRFVGTWDLSVTFHHSGGRSERLAGEWTWSWVLDGCAIQDVWRVPPRSRSAGEEPEVDPPRGFGTTVRLYDPDLDAWHVTWFGAVSHRPVAFLAREVDGEIVMEAQDPGPERTRWIFSEIEPDSFRWRNASSVDDGETWVVNQEMEVRRRPPGRV
jgi:hypothetical protein